MAGIRSAALLVAICGSFVFAEKATPISKVLEMLNEMMVKARAEAEAEAVQFAKFSQWCDSTSRTKTNEITKGTELMAKHEAKIGKHAARIRSLTSRINALAEDVGRWQTDRKSARSVREGEATDYQATSQDYQESIDAVANAIQVLKDQEHDRAQAEAALIQVQRQTRVPEETKKALVSLIEQTPADSESRAARDDFLLRDKEAHGYEFQSGGVVAMLEKLQDEFRGKKSELDKQEVNAKHAYEQIEQDLSDSIVNANHESERKTQNRGGEQQEKAGTEGDLAQTTSDRDEDQKYLDSTTQMCATKRSDFAARKKLREDEQVALKKATDIISDSTVKGAGDTHLPQDRTEAALAQLRANTQNPIQDHLASFVAERARSLNSKLLTMVSEHIASDPFGKVKKLIHNLIIKLQEEATAETEHKGWCDAELATNKGTREARARDVDELTTEHDKLTTDIAALVARNAELADAVSLLDQNMAEAAKDRASDKETNLKTIKEAVEAQDAVQRAIGVLKEFYAKSAEATALTQESQSPVEDAPETFDKPYQGMLPEGGSIVDFLDVILSDFARLQSDCEADEAASVQSFKDFMFRSKKDKALKENEISHNEESRTNKEVALHTTEEDLKSNQEQLAKAQTYYQKLKPTCVDSGANYEDRVKQREAEMQSLEEALNILTGVDI